MVRDDVHLLAQLERVARRQLDDAVLLAEPGDRRARRLEDRPEPGARAGVLGERLASGVEDRALRPRAADDRRDDREGDVVERRRPRRDRRAVVEDVRADAVLVTVGRSSPEAHIVGVPPADTVPTSRPARRARRSASARNASAPPGAGYVRKPPNARPSWEATRPASAAAALGVATPARPWPVSHSTSTRSSRDRPAQADSAGSRRSSSTVAAIATRRASASSRSSLLPPTRL